MKNKQLYFLTLILAAMLALTACGGGDEQTGEFTLKNQDGEEVTVPADKPVILFFFTTYT
ncbi:hypothetical protein [Bacillus marinisedimentorum]|uniref:hypothetical protein n=1 Tax=Bacillus marinisedimentorum TaxID=1821260 RepID=UPI000872C9FB|nr:hypothetical protein [Bacillus marinisedimentorum]